ncbi:MAG: phosphoribosylamine--glycine ligase [Synechococcales cyanobacterium CRU_2_2]|nr:phosphoribosylamine--glycine ligase [Synechococcales cyanobacterium CRU_2_2]
MNVLVVGNGGREHALAWALLQSSQVKQVFCAPGNGGTATQARCVNLPIGVMEFEAIAQAAQTHDVKLLVIGPEVPLAQGITDYLQARGLAVFGPTQAGAQLEASKAWAKALMQSAQVPTAASKTFQQANAAKAYVRAQGVPIVVKADGLAAGKGVTVATTVAEAEAAIDAAFSGVFGDAGKLLVIEDCLEGAEASVLALTDGKTIRTLAPAQDHKRIGEGDTGPNTGGMGAYAPAPLVTPALQQRIQAEVLEPTLRALQARGIDYRGILYAGLMITPEGEPQVIEFNCRFGDPETQVVLPLLETPLIDLLLACVEQRLDELPALTWRDGVSACVVAAAGGYPGAYRKGDRITGLDQATARGAIVFHAGTQSEETQAQTKQIQTEQIQTNGGRVLAVTALGDDFDAAFARAYAALDTIKFDEMYYRHDIGYQVRTLVGAPAHAPTHNLTSTVEPADSASC